jgi:hypothetical protein
MVDLTDFAESYEAYEEWAKEKDNEDLGVEFRNNFLDIARRFLDKGDEALLDWRAHTGIPIQESGGQILVELSCLDIRGTEWVRVR